MYKLHVLTILLLVALSNQLPHPMNRVFIRDEGCTVPKPTLTDGCVRGVVSKIEMLTKCVTDKSTFWSAKISRDTDPDQLMFDACCAQQDTLSCNYVYKDVCTADDIAKLIQFSKDCAKQQGGPTLDCSKENMNNCPSSN